jgi:hypothetical protein
MAKKTFLVDIDLSQNQLLNSVIQNLATDPSSPIAGQLIYNSNIKKLKYWNGTAWTPMGNTLLDLGGEPAIVSGSTAQYWRGDKSWQTLNTSVVPEGSNLYFTGGRAIGSTLDGYTTGLNNTIAASDTILTAFGKTQGQINYLLNTPITIGSTAIKIGSTSTTLGGITSLTLNNGSNSVPISVDSNGNLVITGNVYATGSVSAYGSSSGATGGGSGLIGTVYSYANLLSGSTTYLDSDLTSTFNAYTTYQLTQRIVSLENGSATTIATSGSGNAVTSISKSGTTITQTLGTFLTGNQNITVTGDVTGNGSTAMNLTLATVNASPGTYGSSSSIPVLTVNAKGLVTSGSTVAVVANASTLSGTTLASNIIYSSLTSVGTITSGTWKGTTIDPQYGGTGVNNSGKTITLGGNLITSGANALTLTTTGATNVTLPTSGTLYGTATGSITSSQLATSLTDETGTGSVVFSTSPTISTSIVAGTTTFNLLTAATTLGIGATSGTTTINNNLIVSGNLTVNGTTEYINSTTVTVADKNIELGSVSGATDTTANGGGITLDGTTNKTFNWLSATGAWTSSENMDLASGKTYKLNTNDVLSLSGSTLTVGGANGIIINTSNKTITQGIWNGTPIDVAHGGTGYTSGAITRKVTGTITGGTTSFSVNHGFTSGVIAQVFTTSGGVVVDCDIETATAGTTTFYFNVAPSSGTYSYVIVG